MMKVRDMMTKKPECATPDMDLQKVAKMMADRNVGAIPVVENKDNHKIIGMVTDRDIATRAVAKGKNPAQMTAKDIMSTPVATVNQEDDVEDVARMMEKMMVRRIPVVDANGNICGMVAQADIALKATDHTKDVVQSVSKPSNRQLKV